MKQSVQDLLDEDDTETFVKWLSSHRLIQLREDVIYEKRVWQRTLRTPL